MFVEQGGVHGQKSVVASMLDGAFAVAVYKDGALLGLGIGDAADVHECFDDVVESMDIIVVKHKVASRVFEDCGIVLLERGYLG